MINHTIQKYTQYKASGVEWLGDIPEHWEVKRFKYISEIKKGKLPKKVISTNDQTSLPPYMSMEYLRGGEENQWVIDKDAKVIEANETLLLWDGSNAGEFIKSRKGVISSTVAQIDFKDIDKNFAWFFSKFLEIELRKKTIGMGIPHVNGTILNNFPTILPPLSEQQKIAEFLDSKTALIDKAIGIKEKQIALLKERQQVQIHQAVTRGLNPKVAMKDSGVAWIGEIPEHWEVKKVKYVVEKSFSGGTPSTEKLDYWDGGISWVSSVDVKTDYLLKTIREISLKGLINSSSNIAPKGSVIFVTRSGILQHTFAIAILGKEMAINQDIKCIILEKTILAEFFQKIIKGNNSRILTEVRQQAATVESIDMRAFFNLQIPIPPVPEQQQIVIYIETLTKKIATAISYKEQEIEKLKEYKSVLINSVVTGKIKVF